MARTGVMTISKGLPVGLLFAVATLAAEVWVGPPKICAHTFSDSKPATPRYCELKGRVSSDSCPWR